MEQINSNRNDRNMMRNDEHFQYFVEVITLVNRHGADRLKIETQFAELLTAHGLADEALRNIAKSALTKDVKLLDKRRDTALSGMNDRLKGAEKHFREEVRNAARRVRIAMDVYKNIARLPLHEQTSAVFNLLQELRGRYAPDVQAVDIHEWVDELESANNALAQMMRDRRDEAIDYKPETTMKTARKMLDNAFNATTQRINALVVVEGDADYREFIIALNRLTADFHSRLNQRLGRKPKLITE